ncbi:hypothetical protein [Hymenobacter actinosclerus]|uniref:hypothetical protein n=1 Tax=Hymenobacter actinosclerus TaxID=82805 RepID=UPI0011600ED5|nr:hypothetical protein [Hymenobacter actinosclerus]
MYSLNKLSFAAFFILLISSCSNKEKYIGAWKKDNIIGSDSKMTIVEGDDNYIINYPGMNLMPAFFDEKCNCLLVESQTERNMHIMYIRNEDKLLVTPMGTTFIRIK